MSILARRLFGFVFLSLICLPLVVLRGQTGLVVKTDFEGASARVLEIDQAAGRVHVVPDGDPDRGWPCWWAIRIDGTRKGQALTLQVSGSDRPTRNKGQLTDKPLAAGWALPARASLSHDGRTWQHSPAATREGSSIRYLIACEGTSVWIAWGPLFTPQTTTELLTKAADAIPGAAVFTLAESRAGRPVQALRIPPRKAEAGASIPAVWIQARQHAWETGASWVARGLVEWLMAGEDGARDVLDHAETVIVPIMDVDNVATGNGGKEENPRDHNRDWDDAPVFPEVAAAQQHLKTWAAEGRLDFFIDLHNPAPNDAKPFFFAGPPELLSDQARNNRALFLQIAGKHISGPLPVESTPRITGPSYHPLWRKISGQWVTDHGNEHTVSICLETSWNTPESTTEGYRAVGRQLGQAIAEYLQRRKR